MHLPRYWRIQSQRYTLTGEICQQCGARLFPPRDICPACRWLALEPLVSDEFAQFLGIRAQKLPQTVSLVPCRV